MHLLSFNWNAPIIMVLSRIQKKKKKTSELQAPEKQTTGKQNPEIQTPEIQTQEN